MMSFFLLLAGSLVAADQSFDCRKASTPVEKMVCADAALSTLDEEMTSAFAAARSRGDVDLADQRAWLKDVRGGCADAVCLKAVYQRRIEALTRELAGEWNRYGGRHSSGTLTISAVTPTAFAFTLLARNGMHVGEIEGVAERKGTTARFVDAETKCEVTFRRAGGDIAVSPSPECSAFAGMSVSFDGEYGIGEDEAAPLRMADLDVLASGVTDAAFAALTGKDYERFVSSLDDMQYEAKDLDAFGTRVVGGWVRTEPEDAAAIIMSRADGRIYAAVVDDDVIKYFSNDPAFKTKLPKTIEHWLLGFAGRKVVFSSR